MCIADDDAAARLHDCDVHLGAQAVGAIPRTPDNGRQIGAAVVGDLPQRIADDAGIDDAPDPLARTTLHLQERSARDVDAELALLLLEARERRRVPGSRTVEVDGMTERDFVRPGAAADAARAAGREASRRHVEGIAGDEIELRQAPAELERLHECVAEAEAIDAGARIIGAAGDVGDGQRHRGVDECV